MTEPAPADRPRDAAPLVECSSCGAQAPSMPLTWSYLAGERGRPDTVLCQTCTRRNVRGIEGKLDVEWW